MVGVWVSHEAGSDSNPALRVNNMFSFAGFFQQMDSKDIGICSLFTGKRRWKIHEHLPFTLLPYSMVYLPELSCKLKTV